MHRLNRTGSRTWFLFIFFAVLSLNVFAQNDQIRALDEASKRPIPATEFTELLKTLKTEPPPNTPPNTPPNAPSNFAVGQNAQLTAPDGAAADMLGWSVAMDGVTAVVGTPQHNSATGVVYVFTRTGTNWTFQQKITADDGQPWEAFGWSVAIAGDRMIVGAPFEYPVSLADKRGAAYVFVRNAGVWTQEAKLVSADIQVGDRFGYSVAIDGDQAAVSAVNASLGGTVAAGAVYIFGRSSSWTQKAKITAADGEFEDFFGWSVALDGSTLLVGAPFDDVGANANQGSVYFFSGSGASWTQNARLNDSGMAGDEFGNSVDVSGDHAVIGALYSDASGSVDSGRAVIADRVGGVWNLITGFDIGLYTENSRFGTSVAISGDVVIVGAEQARIDGIVGAAFVYKRNPATNAWLQSQRFDGTDGIGSANIGRSVAISGDFAIAGAPIMTVGTNVGQGAAYVLRVLTNNWQLSSFTPHPDNTADARMGFAVALSDDLAVIGAPISGTGGEAFIYARSGNTWTAVYRLTSTQFLEALGLSVAVFGNRNRGTVVVGAPFSNTTGGFDAGAVYVTEFVNGVPSPTVALQHPSGAIGDYFGRNVAVYDDRIVVGTPNDDVSGQVDQGSAQVFRRTAPGVWALESELTAFTGEANDQFGFDVDILGRKVVVGSLFGGVINQGAVNIFERPLAGTTWTEQTQLAPNDGATLDQFGANVAISGNTILVSRARVDGAVYSYVAEYSPLGLSWIQQAKIESPTGAQFFGSSMDIDGNTAVIADNQQAFVFDRNVDMWWPVRQLQFGESLGNQVAISGDKIIVGMPLSDATTPFPLSGRASKSLAADQGGFAYYVNALVPTAANATVGGRVTTSKGAAVVNAVVTMTSADSSTRTARTNSFGFYAFDNVAVGQTVTLAARAKGAAFASKVVALADSVTDLDFVADVSP